ncbi:MAG: hypothetical protein GY737_13810 [Desulfobacteraceae bacterium]|nr:hypothetical protein [Desulfobacteraceae bacterium]
MSEKFMKQLPRELGGKICADGSENKTFHVTTTTGWDAVSLPAGVECKNSIIQVRFADDATALSEDPIPFLFSSESDGSGSLRFTGGVSPGAGKISGILGYVYTGVAGRKIAVMVLA